MIMRYFRMLNIKYLRVIWILLLLMTYIGSIYAVERADIDGLRYEYLKYYQGHGYVTVYGYTSDISEDLIIPSTIKHKNIHSNRACYVSEISSGAFRNCTKLRIVDASRIEEFKSSAFANCTSLKNLTIYTDQIGIINQIMGTENKKKDLSKELLNILKKEIKQVKCKYFRILYVKSHNKNTFHNLADKLAEEGRKNGSFI